MNLASDLMRVEIRLFGPFRILIDGVPVEEARWGRRKSKTLLKLLALQPLQQASRQMHREELIELLWPDQSSEQGLNSLHKTLYAARRALEPGLRAGASSKFLHMRDQLLVLQGDEISVDVSEFERLAEAGLKAGARDRMEAALALCQGELLPEDIYEDWTVVRREQLRSQKESLLVSLAADYEASGETGRAIETYRELVAHNACNEAAHCGLMRLYAAVGQRHLAVEQFRVCKEVLRRELDVEPEAATVQLYERIVAGAGGQQAASVAVSTDGRTTLPLPPSSNGSASSIGSAPSIASPSSMAEAGLGAADTGKRHSHLLRYALAAIVLLGLSAAVAYRLVRTDSRVKFVAVLPLATAADSPDLDYVADGITEGVINDLSRLRQIRVMARSTVYLYRAKGLDPMAAAAQMKVQAALTGRISKRGKNLLVTAELVGVPEGTRLWGSEYDVAPQDEMSVPDKIASAIAANLGVALGSEESERLSPVHTADPSAYRLYLQARYFWNQRSKDGYLKAIELFQRAIALDPRYAAAYAGLADSYSFLGRDEAPTPEYMPKARAAVERALAINDKLGEAHASLAMMTFVYDWNFPAAEREYRRALSLDPGYATGHLLYGVFLASQGAFKESQAQLDQAAELDPLAPIIALCRGYPASYQGRIEPAIKAAQEALGISPGFPAALEDLMLYFERQGRQEAAIEQAVALLRARAQNDLAESVSAVYRQSGYRAAVRTWFEAEEARSAKEYVSPLRIAILAMRSGDTDKAFAWLDRAVKDRNAGLVYLTVDPKYASLRSDPRFASIAARIGLKPAGR